MLTSYNICSSTEAIVANSLERDWKGILTALVVIMAMCSIIVAAVLLFTPLTTGFNESRSALTIADILSANLGVGLELFEWIDTDKLLLKTEQNYSVIDTSKSDFSTAPFVAGDILTKYGKVIVWSMSHNGKYVALGFKEKKRPRYRHSQYIEYKIAQLPPSQSSDQGIRIIENVGLNKEEQLLQLFHWNPVSDSYVFVYDNNIYYRESPNSNETFALTNTTSPRIYNGIADWIYEEEIFSSEVALWWSNSGKYLAYASFDDRNVTLVEYPIYENQQYATINHVPYPKTGSKNLPKVSLYIFESGSKKTKKLNIRLKNESYKTYLFSASWITIRKRDMLVAVFANRFQNYISITICTFDTGNCILNFDMPFKIRGRQLWAEPEDFRIRHFTNDSYFVILPHLMPNQEIYNHIARITVPNPLTYGKVEFLPNGNYDVAAIKAHDAEKGRIYYLAPYPKPSQQHLLVTADSASNFKDTCITCDSFDECTFQEVAFSKGIDKFIVLCLGPRVHRMLLTSVSSNITVLKEFGDHKELKQKYDSKMLPKTYYENVTLENGFVSMVELILPYDLDFDSVDQKYPAIVSVYAGPGSQKVLEEYSTNNIDTYLGTRYIIIFIDGRGSGMRGWSYKEPLLGKIGTVEVDDQIETVKLLIERHRFIDPQKIGIWGWSYGGFAAAKAIERDWSHTFLCAASIAPVTDFKLYDATYTERYMANASLSDYETADLKRNVTRFKAVDYLIVHGTADDNVHLQNTLQFIKTLEEENIHFQLMVYPDGTHALLWARYHLYTLLSEFFSKCFS
uniref:Dipeptidyl peptidase 4 n=1 Tax=Syphacia muris TaxID=451379 RepID=A0A0N5AMA7_9BILA